MNLSKAQQDNNGLASQLTQELLTRYSLPVSPSWLADFFKTVRQPPPPFPALVSTANFRLLNSDFTQSLSSTLTANQETQSLLPRNVSDVNTKHSALQGDVCVQVLDIVDVGSSKYAQIEAIERVERGEEVRGREVIRNVPIMNEDEGTSGVTSAAGQAQGSIKKSAGPHRILLQDAAGTKVWGFEIVSVPKLFVTTAVEGGGLQIGAKVLLRKGVAVKRGLVMCEPEHVVVLGGKVEEWDKKWRTGRKKRLLEELKRESEEHD